MIIARTIQPSDDPLPRGIEVVSFHRSSSGVRIEWIEAYQGMLRRTVVDLTSSQARLLEDEHCTIFRSQPENADLTALIGAGLMALHTVGPGAPATYATYRVTWSGQRISDAIWGLNARPDPGDRDSTVLPAPK